MKEVIRFILKGIVKSKYTILLPITIILLVVSLMGINSSQSGATQKELQDTFKNRKDTVNFLINRALSKERHIGLTTEQRQSLDSLLSQEEYVKEILNKLNDGNLHISTEHLAYIIEYQNYETLVSIPYNNKTALKVEQHKAEELMKYNLSYTEQKTPFKSALFTKQLFQLLFSPITALLFLLIFCYKYLSDKENRTFDFFTVNSLSHVSIYYGYLIPLLTVVMLYIIIASFLSLLPPLITGNIKTIYYPIEVGVGSEIMMVPVWKWLVFLPIGWGIFISLLLLLSICLFKQRATLGLLFSLISALLLISYVISLQFGFHMANPIHLITSYESNLLPTHRYLLYLTGMLFLLIISFIISYPVIKSKNIVLKFPTFTLRRYQKQSRGKFKLFQFEHLKKKRKGHILFTWIMLITIFGGTFALVNQQYQTIPTKALNTIKDFQNAIIENRTHWELIEYDFELETEMLKLSTQQTGEELEFMEESPYATLIKNLNNQFEQLESLKDDIHSPDFPETFRKVMKSFDSPTYKEMDPALWSVTVMASEEQQNILDEKGITAWPIGHQWVSHFNDPSNAISSEQENLMTLFQERNTKYENSGLFTVYKYLDWNVMLFVLAFFVLILWTTISEERQPNPAINFLATKPIRFTSIYMTKWLYNLAIAYSLLFVIGFLMFLLTTLIGGLGDMDYPILIYATEKNENYFFYSAVDNAYFYFDNLSLLLMKSGILIFTQIFFLNSLFSFIGKWMNNHYATIVITLIIAIVGFFLGNHYIAIEGMYMNPFVYFDTWNIVDGWKSIEASNGKVNFLSGSVILLTCGSLLFCIGLLTRKKAK